MPNKGIIITNCYSKQKKNDIIFNNIIFFLFAQSSSDKFGFIPGKIFCLIYCIYCIQKNVRSNKNLFNLHAYERITNNYH